VDLLIRHLWKTYPNGVAALQDVTLTIAPGLFGLLGPNGAGKSTLMRILATLQEADAGHVHLGDVDVLRDHEAVRRTLGYLPQEFGLYPRATAEQMLDHFALLKGIVNGRERRETVAALLQQTNLYGARKQKLGGFSGGMRQRFGIAVALIGNPRLIIVDEPTAGLDPAERARFLNLLSELGENAVVILSTHIVEDVSDLCTRMAVIAGGRILLEGQPARAVEALRGHIWRRQVDRAELPRFEQAMPVISTTLAAGRTVIHVYGDAPPDPTFEPVEPDLKDVYFTLIRGIRIPQPYGVSDIPPSDGNVMGVGRPSPGPSVVADPDADTVASADEVIPRADVAPGPDPATASSGDGGAAPLSAAHADADAAAQATGLANADAAAHADADADAVAAVGGDVHTDAHADSETVAGVPRTVETARWDDERPRKLREASTASPEGDRAAPATSAPTPDPATASSGDGGAAPPPTAPAAGIDDRPAAVDRPMAVDEPRAGPGAAHVPRFADVGEDAQAGVSREDGGAEASRPEEPRVDGGEAA
jgi:ABC-type multidrug transport system ATPase subunit